MWNSFSILVTPLKLYVIRLESCLGIGVIDFRRDNYPLEMAGYILIEF